MLRTLVGLAKVDIERQTAWAQREFDGRTKSIATKTAFAVLAGIAGILAAIVGLMALFVWALDRFGIMPAFAIVGGVLAVASLLFLALAMANTWRSQPRPPVALADGTAIAQALRADASDAFSSLRQSSLGPAITAGEHAVKAGEHAAHVFTHLRQASTPSLLATLGAAALLGLLVGRKF